MKPARIALVSDAVLPFNKGGKETRIYHLSTELVRLGYIVDIYTMQWWKGATYKQEGITYHALSRYYPLYSGKRRSIKEGILFGLACLKLVRYDFDILEVDHMPFFPLYAAKVVSLLKRRPLYATWHEVWGRAYWQEYLGVFKGTIAFILAKLSAQLPDHIIAVSPQTQHQLRQVLGYKGPVTLVSNGIDYQRVAAIPASSTKSDLIYVGRLLTHKHVDVLIGAMAQLRADYPHLQCLIVGDGPERSRLQALVAKHSLEANVSFGGFLDSSDEVMALMKASRLFVLPSTREGFGIAVLEAFACGLPVVTVDHPDNAARHLITPGLGLVSDLSVPALAQAIENVLHEPRSTLSPQRQAQGYDWKLHARTLAEVYAS